VSRSARVLASFLLLVLATSLLVASPAVGASSLQVHTQSGDVLGVNQGTVDEWRGIPYAAPPVGDLRWRPPAPVAPWSGVRDATEFAPPCIQPGFGPDGPAGAIGRENCLYLNVFVPASASSTSGLPVMVHLHPGGNVFGSPYEDAAPLVERNVIVVTVAYRLGVFGFVGHPALSREGGGTSGEYGLFDQIASLEWVRDNISAFGGDPSNVTLFGSSAGTFDTVALMASPLAGGLFARAAVQGEYIEAFTGVPASATIDEPEIIGRFTFRRFDCGDRRRTVSCLRDQPARRVIASGVEMEVFDLLPWVGGEVLPEAPEELLQGSSLPLLVGFDREEDRFFDLPSPLPDPFTRRMWIERTNALLGPTVAEQARALYRPSEYGSRAWAFITMATDVKRGCPTRRLANMVAAPTWRWLFTHTFENHEGLADGRAAHIFEEFFLWGRLDRVFDIDYTPTPAEELLSERMIGYWTNYAKTGNPNGPGLPTWPQYNTVTEPTLILDNEISVVHGYHVEECALLDTVDEVYP
jgi:para-nitrobenzyl esterase